MARFTRVISVLMKVGPREAGHDGAKDNSLDQSLGLNAAARFPTQDRLLAR